MFGGPPIVCHHDFSKCALDPGLFPPSIHFVRSHLETAWGSWSVVEATVRALRDLYSHSDPDWFVLLSGSDYPIKPAAVIEADLSPSATDAWIHHELIDPRHFGRDWHRICRDRFFTRVISFPSLTRRLRPTRRSLRLTHPGLPLALLPFSATLRCFAGSQWFTGSRRAAKTILDFHDTQPRLAAHYRGLASFGPTWFHPLGGHLFSVLPWAHFLFTERALLRWRADFKSDGATRFGEVAGGLNQMTISRFVRVVAASPFELAALDPVPIRKLAWLSNRLTRELTTAIVRVTLRKSG